MRRVRPHSSAFPEPRRSPRRRRRPHGQGLIEYAIVLSVIALVVFGVLQFLGGQVKSSLCSVTVGLAGQSSSDSMVLTPALADGAGPLQMVLGPDNNLWFTEEGQSKIGTVNLTTKALTEFATTGTTTGIVVGPDNRLWFTEPNANKVGAVTTAGVVSEWSFANPMGIAVGPDSNIWFTEQSANNIVAVNTSGVSVHAYGIPTGGTLPASIITGSDNNLWFTEWGVAALGKLTTGGSFTQVANGQIHNSVTLVSGPKGEVWVSEEPSSLVFAGGSTNSGSGGPAQVARVDPTTGNVIEQINIDPNFSIPVVTVMDSGNNVWVANAWKQGSGTGLPDFEQISPNGQLCETPANSTPGAPVWIAKGPGTTLYFTAQAAVYAAGTFPAGGTTGAKIAQLQ